MAAERRDLSWEEDKHYVEHHARHMERAINRRNNTPGLHDGERRAALAALFVRFLARFYRVTPPTGLFGKEHT